MQPATEQTISDTNAEHSFLRVACDKISDFLRLPPMDRIPADQMDFLRSATTVGMRGHILNTVIAALALYSNVPVPLWLTWTLASLAMAGMVLVRRRATKASSGGFIRPKVIRRAIVFSVSLALPWAALTVFFLDPADQARTLVIFALIVGMAASGTILLAPVYPAAFAYILTILAPTMLVFATFGGVQGYPLLVFLGMSYGAFLFLLVAVVARLSIDKSLASSQLEKTFSEIKKASSHIDRALQSRSDDVGSSAERMMPLETDIVETLTESACRLIAQESALRTSQARLASLVDTAIDAIISIDDKDRITSLNPAARHMFDRDGDGDIGRPVSELMEYDSAARLDGLLKRLRTGHVENDGGGSLIEMNGRKADGIPFPIEMSIASAVSAGEELMTLIVRDVTHRKYSESKLNMLMCEVNHRSRNLLSVLASVSAITAARTTSHGEFNTKFSERLQSLAQSHEIVMNDEWSASSMIALIEAQSKPFHGNEEQIFRLSGPDVFLKPRAVQNLGLAFHELATNSAKYGALSIVGGYIDLRWRITKRSGSAPVLYIVWREVGGPPVEKTERRGFGTLLLDRVVGEELTGKSRIKHLKAGLVWQAEVGINYFSPTPSPKGVQQEWSFQQSA